MRSLLFAWKSNFRASLIRLCLRLALAHGTLRL